MSQGDDGLAARLGAALPGVRVKVNVADLLDDTSTPITPAMVQAALTEELRLDLRWSRYLGRSGDPRWWLVYTVRWMRRGWLRLRPPDPSLVRRLLNIELSHRDLINAGLEAGADWLLILEDDAFASDISDLADGLSGLMEEKPGPDFVTISRSFTVRELGIGHLLRPVTTTSWQGAVPRSILRSERPVTNTVCAILYSARFAEDLVAAFDNLPMQPVVPIDWKLNQALVLMFETGQLRPGGCWLVEPPPITQLSMQAAGILPS